MRHVVHTNGSEAEVTVACKYDARFQPPPPGLFLSPSAASPMAMTRAQEAAILFEFERDEKGRTMFEDDGQTWKLTERAKQAQKAVSCHPFRVISLTLYKTSMPTLSEMGEAVQHIPSNQVSPSQVHCFL